MSMHDVKTIPHDVDNYQAILTVYTEICKSYQAVDDFRTKLLGFLPLTSLVGIFILNPDSMLSLKEILSLELLGFASIFAALLTLALFGYEVRGIRRSDDLIKVGKHLEKELGIDRGQFHVCEYEHKEAQGLSRVFNSKSLACIIYSVVLAAWLFLALRLEGVSLHSPATNMQLLPVYHLHSSCLARWRISFRRNAATERRNFMLKTDSNSYNGFRALCGSYQ